MKRPYMFNRLESDAVAQKSVTGPDLTVVGNPTYNVKIWDDVGDCALISKRGGSERFGMNDMRMIA